MHGPMLIVGRVTHMMSLVPSPSAGREEVCDAEQLSAHNVMVPRAHFETHAPWPHSIIVER